MSAKLYTTKEVLKKLFITNSILNNRRSYMLESGKDYVRINPRKTLYTSSGLKKLKSVGPYRKSKRNEWRRRVPVYEGPAK